MSKMSGCLTIITDAGDSPILKSRDRGRFALGMQTVAVGFKINFKKEKARTRQEPKQRQRLGTFSPWQRPRGTKYYPWQRPIGTFSPWQRPIGTFSPWQRPRGAKYYPKQRPGTHYYPWQRPRGANYYPWQKPKKISSNQSCLTIITDAGGPPILKSRDRRRQRPRGANYYPWQRPRGANYYPKQRPGANYYPWQRPSCLTISTDAGDPPNKSRDRRRPNQ